MPFTISHIAAVVPLRRTRLSFSALVIGSMSPDYSYVIAIFGPAVEVHTLLGVIFFCTPISILAWMLYERWMHRGWVTLFPWLTKDPKPVGFAAAGLSCFIGAATHVIWDSFTQSRSWVVKAIPLLHGTAFEIGGHVMPTYNLLQHLSTVFGGLAVAAAVWSAARRVPGRPMVTSWGRLAAVCGVVAFLTFLYSIPVLGRPGSREMQLVIVLFRMLGAMATIAVVYPLFAPSRSE